MKKGFTLLELLAVIVVLAIIALIVTPFVSKAIENAKKGSFKNSVYGLIESAELYSGSKMTRNDFSETILHSVNGTELSGLNFKYKGKKLKDVYLQIDDKGKIRLLVWDDGFCAKKEFEDSEVVVTNSLEADCSLMTLNAPIITGGSNDWALSRVITVTTEPNNIELDHYQYYLSTSGNGDLIGGHWVDLPHDENIIKNVTIDASLLKEYENSDDENFEIDLKREYYVYFRGVDVNNKNGLISNVEPVKIDNEEYDITLANMENGTVSVVGNVTKAKLGTNIVLEPAADATYRINSLIQNNTTVVNNTFVMPRQDVTIRATFVKTTYNIEYVQNEGGVISGVLEETPGQTVTVSVILDNNYFSIKSLKYNGNEISNSNTYNFIMPSEDVTITVLYNYNREIPYSNGYTYWIVPMSGNYKIEAWGAQGGTSGIYGSKGGYAKGVINLTEGEYLYIYAGGKGAVMNATPWGKAGGFNGGGASGNGHGAGTGDWANAGSSGGGASDVRCFVGENNKCVANTNNLAWNDAIGLRSRIIVAGGGGGMSCNADSNHGHGGGTSGIAGVAANGTSIAGGTQTGGCSFGGGCTGRGCSYLGENAGAEGGGGGGGGYYGGTTYSACGNLTCAGGGGGSSFVSGHVGCNAVNRSGIHTNTPNHYSGKIFSHTEIKAGNQSMPTFDGTSTMVGNADNGYVKITLEL